MIYDSLCPSEYILLHAEIKRYIQRRYPHLTTNEIFLQPVTRQPGAYRCGVYATAFATTIALGSDPSLQMYSRDMSKMREHLTTIVRTRQLLPFPAE